MPLTTAAPRTMTVRRGRAWGTRASAGRSWEAMTGDPRARPVGSLRAMSAPRSAVADTSTKPFAPVRLSEVVGSRQNNFDLLRLLAAWAVLVSHSFAVLDRPEPLHQ